jgi:hypothetical protein
MGSSLGAVVVRFALVAMRGANCIIEGRESAVVGAHAARGASAPVGRTLVGTFI